MSRAVGAVAALFAVACASDQSPPPPAAPAVDQVGPCVADGPTEVIVPNVIAMRLDAAIARVRESGLVVVGSGVPPGDPAEAGAEVISQEPGAGTRVPARACVGFRTQP